MIGVWDFMDGRCWSKYPEKQPWWIEGGDGMLPAPLALNHSLNPESSAATRRETSEQNYDVADRDDRQLMLREGVLQML